MLVGSIAWTRKDGDQVKKGDELGYFAYGGSTVIVAFPAGSVTFDEVGLPVLPCRYFLT